MEIVEVEVEVEVGVVEEVEVEVELEVEVCGGQTLSAEVALAVSFVPHARLWLSLEGWWRW